MKGYDFEEKIIRHLQSQSVLKMYDSNGGHKEIDIYTKDYIPDFLLENMPEISTSTIIRPLKANFGVWDIMVFIPSTKRGNYNFNNSKY